MPKHRDNLSGFQTYSENLIDTYKVPTISLTVWHNIKLYISAAGILNMETVVEATTGPIFQIGSISKPMTEGLVMSLVDEGRSDLDRPVKRQRFEFLFA